METSNTHLIETSNTHLNANRWWNSMMLLRLVQHSTNSPCTPHISALDIIVGKPKLRLDVQNMNREGMIVVVFMRMRGVFSFLVLFVGCALSPGQAPWRNAHPTKNIRHKNTTRMHINTTKITPSRYKPCFIFPTSHLNVSFGISNAHIGEGIIFQSERLKPSGIIWRTTILWWRNVLEDFGAEMCRIRYRIPCAYWCISSRLQSIVTCLSSEQRWYCEFRDDTKSIRKPTMSCIEIPAHNSRYRHVVPTFRTPVRRRRQGKCVYKCVLGIEQREKHEHDKMSVLRFIIHMINMRMMNRNNENLIRVHTCLFVLYPIRTGKPSYFPWRRTGIPNVGRTCENVDFVLEIYPFLIAIPFSMRVIASWNTGFWLRKTTPLVERFRLNWATSLSYYDGTSNWDTLDPNRNTQERIRIVDVFNRVN